MHFFSGLRFACTLLISTLAVAGPTTANAETVVVTSIKPLALLVQAVATDDTRIVTLVPPGASPHSYSMRPSQRRELARADIIFWVGPDMETFLTRLLTGQDFSNRTVALGREPDAMAGHETKHEDEHHETAGHDHQHGDGQDPHIWVDPALAVDMARKIVVALSQLPDQDVAQLDRNLTRFENAVKQREAAISEQLEPTHDIRLFAYHSALTRFADHYGLHIEDVLTLNPELSPGARHVAEIRNKLGQAKHPCVLTEPQFNRQWWQTATEGMDVIISTWDPLATDIKPSASGYLEFQQSIADAILRCLPEQAEH
ncbi:periplasmic solute binding protein [Marinobacter santoriniensis NKSG1]|uniref:High-affinity zinc uptake system protein ZnuA n=1 Tax=Marinobacter santoriniensis NKSG1 TaxID=1288826 RepID=M7CRJ7_9GAMM|nr:zinc ABC transporter substrate-binding protein [Marinobacter santoriniensis]EMP55794.1 periplasmic solute binding protein [Marinobacter santoriniensis NKSG1]